METANQTSQIQPAQVVEVDEARRWYLQNVRSALEGIDAATEELHSAVARARAAGWSWREIGTQVGTSAQAAHARFGRKS